MKLRFEWDEVKAASNIRKHGGSFEEALTVVGDPYSLTIYDERHSEKENRFMDMGLSTSGRVLAIVYVEQQTCIRIISCRKATRKEQMYYESRIY